MKNYLPAFKNCLQHEVSFCRSACPFYLDVSDMIEKLQRGDFNAAYKTYKNATGFPAIASHLCPAPCKEVCPLGAKQGAIDLPALEKACLTQASAKEPADYNLPEKKGNIAIVGAGISGLSCALRLATKKYPVTVFEKEDHIGGSILEIMDNDLFTADINLQFKHEEYRLHLSSNITDPQQLADFDAVYIATGTGGWDMGLSQKENPCTLIDNTGFFAGGSLLGKALIYAMADGLEMSTTIDNFLKTKNLTYTKPHKLTAMCLEPSHLTDAPPVKARGKDGYTKEQATEEASRCLRCHCDACRVHCDLTDFYGKWPLRIRDEIQATTLPGSAEVKATPAKRLIDACNQCGLCKETCPEDIDLGGLILAARKSMHKQGKAPWAFRDFWLRDMDFSDGPEAGFTYGENCQYAFFPGCQLGAGDPDLVKKGYEYLLEKDPNTGLIIRCCGVPALWAGQEEKFKKSLSHINDIWEDMGNPTLVLACPTCASTLKKHLSHIPCIFIYDLLAQDPNTKKVSGKYSVFDPCSVKNPSALPKNIRTIAEKSGAFLVPLSDQDLHHHCCGYGGQVAIADPKFFDSVVNKRISLSDTPYITYCINCRDVFLKAGKDALHILNIALDTPPPVKLPTVTQRRENRKLLKEYLSEKYLGEKTMIKNECDLPHLEIDEALKEKLSDDRILEEEIAQVIASCEKTRRKVYDENSDTYTGYKQIGNMTYWAEYKKIPGGFRLINAYEHRVKIEMEVVWNGEKVDPDMF